MSTALRQRSTLMTLSWLALACVFVVGNVAATDEATEEIVLCEHNGTTYSVGERIITENVCEYCSCYKGWNESRSCAIIDCPWGYYKQRFYCQQQYVAGECCPKLQCAAPSPRFDPDVLKGKKVSASTAGMTIKAMERLEVFMYCLVDAAQQQSANVTWSKMVDGQKVRVTENSELRIDHFENPSASALYFMSVNKTDAGVYVCASDNGAFADQTTTLEVTDERPGLKNPVCNLPPVRDGSRSCELHPSDWGFYYDPKTINCEKHDLSSISCPGPSENHFATLEECWYHCSDDCYSQIESGDCDNQVHRYAYDHVSDSCKEFNYSGCGGNRNRFEDPDSCYRTCASVSFETEESAKQPWDRKEACKNHKCTWEKWIHYLVKKCRPVMEEQSCCPTRFDCSEETAPEDSASVACEYGGQNYTSGEKISLPDYCQECTCSAKFTGPGSSTCEPVSDCNKDEMLAKMTAGCVPVYKKDQCCPTAWECPVNDTFYRQQGPQLLKKPPAELQCSFADRLYVRPYELITYTGSCRKCACLTPPLFTCEDTACPLPPSASNSTLRCKKKYSMERKCCPDYECWDVFAEPQRKDLPQTDVEISACDAHPCGTSPGYMKCVVNYTECQLGNCIASCDYCPIPGCSADSHLVYPPHDCMTCAGPKTPEEACRGPQDPCGFSDSKCSVDEDECRQGNCRKACRIPGPTIIQVSPTSP